MNQKVVIKGSKNGITLVLDREISFMELKEVAAQKFKDSAKFLGDAKMAISFEGRRLNDREQYELLQIISDNTDLDVVCVLENDPAKNAAFKKAIDEKLQELSSSTGQFYKGNLRSGQVLETETSVIVIGDVNAGANIISKGNIIILGSLKGTAYAGVTGNEDAFVLALDMDPVQIRIAESIARSPDHRNRDEVKEPKIAFLENGSIYIEGLNKRSLSDIRI